MFTPTKENPSTSKIKSFSSPNVARVLFPEEPADQVIRTFSDAFSDQGEKSEEPERKKPKIEEDPKEQDISNSPDSNLVDLSIQESNASKDKDFGLV